MNEFVVDIHEFRDRSYTIGYEQGRLLDKKQLAVYETFTKESMDLEGAQTVLKAFAPHLLEEIHGLADGLRIPYDIAMRYFSGYDLPKLQAMGCSSIVTQDFMVRNYDFSPLIYDHQLVFAQSEETYGSVGYSPIT
ncbi:hypothetical protein [Alkalihalobacillus sp. TS-13]|uniref:hypothetical protein n=1 Tax=Alkalihalobacillus sp. TS-13 TaxID=2842455 RepID=UPI001C88902A|nr:hypothetical protein [Alkalihalobacillus sp. TS-13]